jgi:hypothetical protein
MTKKTTTNSVFATAESKKAGLVKYRLFLLGPDSNLITESGRQCHEFHALREVFAHAARNSAWISTTLEKTEILLKEASTFLALHHGRRGTLGNLLLYRSPRIESLPALHTVFRSVIGAVKSSRLLPHEELTDVLLSPRDEARDLFIGGSIDLVSQTLTLTRGDFETVIVPFSIFRPSGTTSPDWTEFGVGDYGHTVRFGEYEAAADAILYEVDPEFRKRQNAKRRQEERGFGASLRRLRIQKRLARTDFPGLSAKTIARIEKKKTGKPHERTLGIIAETLGVSPDEIETY